VGFVLERSLGHSTHASNLARLLPPEPAIRSEILEIDYGVSGWAARLPVYRSNWTVRSGMIARRGISRMQSGAPLDALFIHTQVPAVLSQRWMRQIPTVVSLDATPLQYDELGDHYEHQRGPAALEWLKFHANRSCLQRAVHVVTWSEWAKHGVVDGYGVAADKVTVIPPGVAPSLWKRPELPACNLPIRILFVGGDLRRKGGDVLLESYACLRAVLGDGAVELHLATRSIVPDQPGVHVHTDLGPNSRELIELYHRSDIFCLPTRGDCLPMVLSEAGAAGLPLVSTAVAGIPEIVREGKTGLTVPIDDVGALTHALRTLIDNPSLRRSMGAEARTLVAAQFDAEKNTRRLVELLVGVAARSTVRTAIAGPDP
jgi:glycosyltransferase involved in cell wall biosynthesis